VEFNFYEQFSNYSTSDLLEIVQQPGKYQAEAVSAAELLLKERVVSDSERADVQQHLAAVEAEERHRSEQAEARMQKIAEYVNPTLNPEKAVSPRRLFFILLIAFGISYCFFLYGFIKSQVSLLRCEDCRTDLSTWLGFFQLAYETIMFFLLVRKKRWGWILLFVFNAAMVLPLLYDLYFWHKTIWSIPGLNHGITATMILSIIYPIAIAAFLWRPVMTRIFGIDRNTRGYSLLAGAVISVGLMVLFS
jgi:hypothetical protein